MKAKNWKQLERAFKKMLLRAPMNLLDPHLTRAQRKREDDKMWDKIITDFNHDLMEFY